MVADFDCGAKAKNMNREAVVGLYKGAMADVDHKAMSAWTMEW